jgi:HAMP domain-containing protein/predicted RNA-binding protein YlqC (UPF0109 family)
MRIPLHWKVMASYLLVVGLVFFPSVIYLRTIQRREIREDIEKQMRADLALVARRVGEVPADQVQTLAERLILRQRLTLVDTEGNVLFDTYEPRPLGNHADRPEIRAALTSEDGFGSATRVSATTGEELIYEARRYPLDEPPRGVVRLAARVAKVTKMQDRVAVILTRAAAGALSAAVLLSFVASLVISRPLRRIMAGARAFAAGDFAYPVPVRSNDELGDVATALVDLAAQLRDRLLAAGADRATLHALLDELPAGVVLYDAEQRPSVMNGLFRELCGVGPKDEIERALSLPRLPEQAAAVEGVLVDGLPREHALALPWRPEARLRARWLCTFASGGERQLALVVLDERPRERLDGLARTLVELARDARGSADAPLAVALARAASEAEADLPLPPVTAGEVRGVPLGALCRDAAGAVPSGVDAARLELSVCDEDARVVEVGGRTARALRGVLAGASDAGRERRGVVAVKTAMTDRAVRVEVSVPVDRKVVERSARLIRGLGGDAGVNVDGDAGRTWLSLPRA